MKSVCEGRPCLGVDVSKATLDGVVHRKGTPLGSSRQPHHLRVENTQEGTRRLCAWACDSARCEPAKLRVVFEATGTYHLTGARTAHAVGCEVVIASPRRVHQYARGIGRLSKNDKVDATTIANFGSHVASHVWKPPPPEIAQLQMLVARRCMVEEAARRDEARALADDDLLRPEAVRQSIRDAVRFNACASEAMTAAIDRHYLAHPALHHDRQLLLSMPGVGEDCANRLLCLLRSREFASAREAAALCGLVPVHRHSGTHTSSAGRISKESNRSTNAALRIMAISAAKHDPALKAIYEGLLQRGKHRRQARTALMRRMLHIAYGILKHQKSYDPAWMSKSPEDRTSAPVRIVRKRLRRNNERRLARLRKEEGDSTVAGDGACDAVQWGPRQRRHWTPTEVQLLREQAGSVSLEALATTLKRTPAAVQCRAYAEGLSTVVRDGIRPALRQHQRWSAEERKLLREQAGRVSSDELAMALHRTRAAVQVRCNLEGISTVVRDPTGLATRQQQRWTREELQLLHEQLGKVPLGELAVALKRTPAALNQRLYRSPFDKRMRQIARGAVIAQPP